jgi:2-keto-4-pentenoate hydratase/2-oxohepta-3-ene-1,7-dioic acid hydratase in catechol pathway
MKFSTWITGSMEEAGILSKDLLSVHSFGSIGLPYTTVLEYIINRKDSDFDRLKAAQEKAGKPVSEVKFQAPIPRPHHDVICLGLNYRDHAQEAAKFDIVTDEKRQDSVYFSKRVIRALGPEGIIENHFDIDERLDYEAEMAIIIGKDARYVKKEDAYHYIFGVCCFNDISGRDMQNSHKQWFFGKSLDTFTAYGPYIVTLDEFNIPLKLDIKCRVNGETRQNSNTENLIFPPEIVIEELSSGMTLDAGTIIATGTPAGVGAASSPHRCMKSGDICEVEVEGCGVLRNTVG